MVMNMTEKQSRDDITKKERKFGGMAENLEKIAFIQIGKNYTTRGAVAFTILAPERFERLENTMDWFGHEEKIKKFLGYTDTFVLTEEGKLFPVMRKNVDVTTVEFTEGDSEMYRYNPLTKKIVKESEIEQKNVQGL